jgi:chromosome segregation ATPase
VIVREYYEVQEKFKEIKKHIRWSKKFINKIKEYLDKREKTFIKLRGYLSLRCTMDFNILLDQRGFKGKLNFNHTEQTLVINVQPNKEIDDSRTKDLRALSGGERSFSTVCYVLALWQAIQSPLRCLDEFDVFMDMANRRVAMDMMVEMAQMQTNKQFIFLTPHDISALPKSQKIHVWRMADPKRGQSSLSLERAPSTQP